MTLKIHPHWWHLTFPTLVTSILPSKAGIGLGLVLLCLASPHHPPHAHNALAAIACNMKTKMSSKPDPGFGVGFVPLIDLRLTLHH